MSNILKKSIIIVFCFLVIIALLACQSEEFIISEGSTNPATTSPKNVEASPYDYLKTSQVVEWINDELLYGPSIPEVETDLTASLVFGIFQYDSENDTYSLIADVGERLENANEPYVLKGNQLITLSRDGNLIFFETESDSIAESKETVKVFDDAEHTFHILHHDDNWIYVLQSDLDALPFIFDDSDSYNYFALKYDGSEYSGLDYITVINEIEGNREVYNPEPELDGDAFKESIVVPDTPQYTHIEREGYKETSLTFIPAFHKPYDRDPDQVIYDDAGNIVSRDYRSMAQEGLKCIFDMTGFQADELCVGVSKDNLEQMRSTLEYSVDGGTSHFCSVSIDDRTGRILGIFMGFSDLVNHSTNPIAFETLEDPTGKEKATDEEIAVWYLEHSSIVDWYKIVATENIIYSYPEYTPVDERRGEVRCTMEGNGTYRIFLRRGSGRDVMIITSNYSDQLEPALYNE